MIQAYYLETTNEKKKKHYQVSLENGVTLLFTEAQVKTAKERAKKNPSDCLAIDWPKASKKSFFSKFFGG